MKLKYQKQKGGHGAFFGEEKKKKRPLIKNCQFVTVMRHTNNKKI